MGTFRTRHDGNIFPIHPTSTGSAVSLQTFKTLQKQDKKRVRLTTRKERARLATLENPLLWSNFLKHFQKLNPSFDFDGNINKSLEPTEAILDLKQKFPELDLGLKEENHSAEFRVFLDEMGIENSKVQSMVAMSDPPLSENELNELSYILNNRPPIAVATDNALKAPIAKDIRQWIKNPARTDIRTVDRF